MSNPNKVELELTEEEAKLIWCQGIRAHDGFKAAVEDHHVPRMIYYATWALELLDRIGHAAPKRLFPDGSESSKP